MKQDHYIAHLDRALQAEFGIRLPLANEELAWGVRGKFYRVRNYLREKGIRDYDKLRFSLIDGDLLIVKAQTRPQLDDGVFAAKAVDLGESEVELTVHPKPGRRNRGE